MEANNSKNCGNYDQDFWFSLADNELGEDEASGAKIHLQSCSSCRISFERSTALFGAVESAFHADAVTPSARLHAEILGRVREASSIPETASSGQVRPNIFSNPVFWAAAASVVFISFGLALVILSVGAGKKAGEVKAMSSWAPSPVEIEKMGPVIRDPRPEPTPVPSGDEEIEPTEEVEKPALGGEETPVIPPGRGPVEVKRPEPKAEKTILPPHEERPEGPRETMGFELTCHAGSVTIADPNVGGAEGFLQGDGLQSKGGTVTLSAPKGPALIRFGGNSLSLGETTVGSLTRFDTGWELQLEAGEVFCEVDPGRKAGFTVVTESGTVTATGTAFSVGVRSGQTRVRVTRGSVKVEAEREGRSLVAGQGSLIERGRTPLVREGSVVAPLRWLTRLRPHPLAQRHGARGRSAKKSRVRPVRRANEDRHRKMRRLHERLKKQHREGKRRRALRDGEGGRGPGRRGGRGGGGGGGGRSGNGGGRR
ncbi:MAG: anti-sigma factor family protein [Planctomycetota bacterium]